MPKHSHEQRQILKNRAIELLAQGLNPAEVAASISVSLRTLRRWLKDENVIVVAGSHTPEPESPVVEARPEPERLERHVETIELSLTARIAVRLLNLTEVAIDNVEDILTSDASHGSRLKAAQLVSQWVGLNESGGRTTVMGNVTHKLGLEHSDDYEESQVIFTPRSKS